jgi:phage-related protein
MQSKTLLFTFFLWEKAGMRGFLFTSPPCETAFLIFCEEREVTNKKDRISGLF